MKERSGLNGADCIKRNTTSDANRDYMTNHSTVYQGSLVGCFRVHVCEAAC